MREAFFKATGLVFNSKKMITKFNKKYTNRQLRKIRIQNIVNDLLN